MDENEPPELSGIEIVHIASTEIVEALGVDGGRPLEGILANIHHARHVGRDLPAGPTAGLAEELELEIIEPQGSQVRPREVEELMAVGRALVLQEVRLVIAVEVVLVGPV